MGLDHQLLNDEPKIVATKVSLEHREYFYTTYINDILLALEFEATVFNYAASFSKDYSGGLWEFYTLSNGAFFMALDEAESYTVSSPNGFTETLNGFDFGIFVCSMVLNQFCNRSGLPEALQDQFISHYYGLRDFYLDLPSDRLSKLYGLLD